MLFIVFIFIHNCITIYYAIYSLFHYCIYSLSTIITISNCYSTTIITGHSVIYIFIYL